MGNVCVITGGGSGMGLEAAKILGKNSKIILVGRTVSKLDKALAELKTLGIDAQSFPCDAGDRESVKKLADYAAEQGTVKTVIHAAGISPHMADGEKIFAINAVGTINIDEEFAEIMGEGSCILNVPPCRPICFLKQIYPGSSISSACRARKPSWLPQTRCCLRFLKRAGQAWHIPSPRILSYGLHPEWRCAMVKRVSESFPYPPEPLKHPWVKSKVNRRHPSP